MLACATASFEGEYRSAQELLEEGRTAEAATRLEAALAAARADPAPAFDLAMAAALLGDLYASEPALGHAGRADVLRREALRIADEALSGEERDTVYAQLGKEPPSAAESSARAASAAKPSRPPAPEDVFLEPNARDLDGVAAFVRFDESDFPLRIAVPLPDEPALKASPEQTRDAAIDGVRSWERAAQQVMPAFRLEFAGEASDADVVVRWQKRPRGYLPATAALAHRIEDGRVRVRAELVLSTQPVPTPKYRVELGQLRAHAAHAFGYALGLGDCRSCDSLMSLDWIARETFEPTALDAATLAALFSKRNGERVDGKPLAGLPGGALPAVALAAAPAREGVLADLPFLNVGREGPVVIDVAPPDQPSFVVEVDTGADDTVLTTDYARALGVSVRSAKTDPYRRETVTGRPLDFWVMGQIAVGGGRGPAHFDYALLGGEFLRAFVLDVDFPARRVRFLDPAAHAIGDVPGEIVAPLQVNGTHPFVELRIGSASLFALLDTGADGPLMTTEEKARALGIAVDRNAKRTGHVNVFGTQVSAVQTVPSVSLGGVELRDVALQVAIGDESSVRVARWLKDETIVGTDVLSNFRVRLDYQRQKLGLTPAPPRGHGAARSATPPDSPGSR